MHHSDFIAILASIYKPNIYVELGLYEGETLSKVIPYATKIYGIDLKPNSKLEHLTHYSSVSIRYQTTNEFFKEYNGGIDMAFIDADHSLPSVQQDFENVLVRLNPGGVILLHDTDPINDSLIHPGFCGDSYKIVSMLEHRDDINITTFPIQEAGLSIVTKKQETRTQLRHPY